MRIRVPIQTYHFWMQICAFEWRTEANPETTAMRGTRNGHAYQVRVTTAEVPCNCRGTTTTALQAKLSDSMASTTPKSWPEIQSYHSKQPCGIGWGTAMKQLLLDKDLGPRFVPSMDHLNAMGQIQALSLLVSITTETIAINSELTLGIIFGAREENMEINKWLWRCTGSNN